MAPSEDKGRIECSEEEGLLPGNTLNQRHSQDQWILHFLISEATPLLFKSPSQAVFVLLTTCKTCSQWKACDLEKCVDLLASFSADWRGFHQKYNCYVNLCGAAICFWDRPHPHRDAGSAEQNSGHWTVPGASGGKLQLVVPPPSLVHVAKMLEPGLVIVNKDHSYFSSAKNPIY